MEGKPRSVEDEAEDIEPEPKEPSALELTWERIKQAAEDRREAAKAAKEAERSRAAEEEAAIVPEAEPEPPEIRETAPVRIPEADPAEDAEPEPAKVPPIEAATETPGGEAAEETEAAPVDTQEEDAAEAAGDSVAPEEEPGETAEPEPEPPPPAPESESRPAPEPETVTETEEAVPGPETDEPPSMPEAEPDHEPEAEEAATEELRIDHMDHAEHAAEDEDSAEGGPDEEPPQPQPERPEQAEPEEAQPAPDPEPEPENPPEPEPHPAEQPEEPPEARPFEFIEAEAEASDETSEKEDEGSQPAAEHEVPKPKKEAESAEDNAPEHLGHMLVDNETQAEAVNPDHSPVETSIAQETSRSARAAEQKMRVESAPKGPLNGRRIETLNRTELMEIAKGIDIEGNNLLQIYETHLIGERGLRRLALEYQKGGDLSEALKREVLERELDFERDPAIRALTPPPMTSADLRAADGDNPSLKQMLQNVDAAGGSSEEKTAFLKAREKYEAANLANRRHRYRALADAAFFVLIGILTLLVIILYLRRG